MEEGGGCIHTTDADREIQRERGSRNRGRRQEKKDDFSAFFSELSL